MPMMRPNLGSPQRMPVQGMPAPGGFNPGIRPPMPPNRLMGLGGINPMMMGGPMAATMGGMMPPQMGTVRRPPMPMPNMNQGMPGMIPNRLAGIGGMRPPVPGIRPY